MTDPGSPFNGTGFNGLLDYQTSGSLFTGASTDSRNYDLPGSMLRIDYDNGVSVESSAGLSAMVTEGDINFLSALNQVTGVPLVGRSANLNLLYPEAPFTTMDLPELFPTGFDLQASSIAVDFGFTANGGLESISGDFVIHTGGGGGQDGSSAGGEIGDPGGDGGGGGGGGGGGSGTAVPEPVTALLSVIGVAALAGSINRRRA